MKLREIGTALVFLIAGLAAIIGYGTHKFLGMKEDNAIEEMAEEIIESQTGMEVDLSPDSKEKK